MNVTKLVTNNLHVENRLGSFFAFCIYVYMNACMYAVCTTFRGSRAKNEDR